VKYVETNLPQKARDHFHGLREAKGDLVGVAVFDRLDKELQSTDALTEMMWTRREIENYFCSESVLTAYAGQGLLNDLFDRAEKDEREQSMREAIREVADALKTLGKPDPWSSDTKASDDFLDPLFKKFFEKRNLPLQLRKSEYHTLAGLVPAADLDREISVKLDAIVATAKKAKPRT
jgi:hypothetical protein